MLLAVYLSEAELQDLLEKKETDKYIWNEERAIAFDKKLGYSGIIGMNAEDPRTLLINLTLVAHSQCEVMAIVDTNDFVIVDRVRLENYLNGYSELHGKSLDDVFEDILEPDDYTFAYFCIRKLRAKDIKGIYHYDISRYGNEYYYNQDDKSCEEYIKSGERTLLRKINQRKAKDFDDYRYLFEDMPDITDEKMDASIDCIMRMQLKSTFELWLLPAMLGGVYEGFGKNYKDFRMIDVERVNNSDIINDILSWSLQERDAKKFLQLMDRLKCYINPYLVDVHPKAKDMCPCGSGLRYKRCCGKY